MSDPKTAPGVGGTASMTKPIEEITAALKKERDTLAARNEALVREHADITEYRDILDAKLTQVTRERDAAVAHGEHMERWGKEAEAQRKETQHHANTYSAMMNRQLTQVTRERDELREELCGMRAVNDLAAERAAQLTRERDAAANAYAAGVQDNIALTRENDALVRVRDEALKYELIALKRYHNELVQVTRERDAAVADAEDAHRKLLPALIERDDARRERDAAVAAVERLEAGHKP